MIMAWWWCLFFGVGAVVLALGGAIFVGIVAVLVWHYCRHGGVVRW